MAINPEQLLISAILRSGDHVTAAANGLTAKFFHSYPDEYVWIERYISLHKRVPSRVVFKQQFPRFGIKAADDVEHLVEEVRKSHAQTEITSSIQDVIALIEDGDIDMAVRKMHMGALDVEAQMTGMSGDADVIQNYKPILDEVMRRMARTEQFGQAGIPTGFPTLDERTGGPQSGQVWVFAARLGQGKTWSLIRGATAACFSGFTVQYDALEQTRAEIAMRVHTFASSEYGKNVFKNLDLAQGKNFSPREYKEFLAEMRDKVAGKFHIADASRGSISPLTIAAQIERNKPDVVYVDYLTLMDTTGSGDDWKGIGRLSAGIKQIAGRYEIPLVVAAQLNRNAAAGKELAGPEMLAESDAIGRDADAVVTMRQLSKHVIAMKLAKFRHGRDGFTFYTKFLPNTGHFEEVTYDEAMDVVNDDKDAEVDETTHTFKPREKGSFQAMANSQKTYIEKGGKAKSGKSSAQKRVTAPAPRRVIRRKTNG